MREEEMGKATSSEARPPTIAPIAGDEPSCTHLLGTDVLGRVAACHVEPQVWREGVDRRQLVRHNAPVQLAPRGPQSGFQVELVAVALFDGELLDTQDKNISTG